MDDGTMRMFQRLFATLILTCAPLLSAQPAPEPVSIRLKWFHQFQFAGYYAAVEKGFYAQEGLDVTLVEYIAGEELVDAVVAGKSQYGVADSGLILERLRGKPVVLLTQIFQHCPLVYAALETSQLRTPFDLAGRNVMTYMHGVADAPLTAMLVKCLGSIDKVRLVPHTYRNDDLLDGRVDAMLAYSTNEPFWFAGRGVKVTNIDPRDYGIDFYGDNFFTAEREIREHPERVDRMCRATKKGWQYALDHQDEVVDLILAKYNSQKKSREHLVFEAESTEKLILPRFVEIGHGEPSRFQKIIESYVSLGLCDKTKLDERFFYRKDVGRIELTAEERGWFKEHPVVLVGAIGDYPPYEFTDIDGTYKGIAVDILRLVAQRVGFEVKPVITTWSEVLQNVKAGKVDLLPQLVDTPGRRESLDFTKPHLFTDSVFVFRQDHTPVASVRDLKGLTLVVEKGYNAHDFFAAKHPEVKLHVVDTPQQAMLAVSAKQADAYVGTYAVVAYLSGRHLIGGLKTAPCTEIGMSHLCVGFRKGLPQLASAVQKGLNSVTDTERREIVERYYKVEEHAASLPSLTDAERQWLRSHPTVRIAPQPDFAPLESFDEKGRHIGLVADYLALIAERTGVTFEIVRTQNWQESLDAIRNGSVDMLPAKTPDGKLSRDFLFAGTYFSFPDVILSSQRTAGSVTLEDLVGKTVLSIARRPETAYLRKSHPKINVVEVASAEEGLLRLSRGECEFMFGHLPTCSYSIARKGIKGIRLTGISSRQTAGACMVRKDWPELVGIINKALADIPEEEKQALRSKWVVRMDGDARSIAEAARGGALRTLVYICGTMVVLMLAVWLLMRLVGDRLPVGLQSAAANAAGMIVMSLFLTVVVGGAWFGLRRLEQQMRESVGEQLKTMVEATHESLRSWINGEKQYIEHLAADPRLIALARQQLAVPRTAEALVASDAQKGLRAFFAKDGFRPGDLGFFLIAPDLISVGSMRDANVGTRNLIVQHRPAQIQAAFAGKTVFVPPMRSDVPIPDEAGKLRDAPATMFFATPVKNENGDVIAVMTLRIDPARDFTRLCQLGRLGQSGEAYAFDRSARLLSGSRFESDLVRAGLIGKSQQSILSVRLADPGADLREGYRTPAPLSEQPLTRMAADAVAGGSGVDVDGYRDYRGVRVLGGWTWDNSLDLGVAVEIDESDALTPYRANRRIVIGILGVTVLLSLLLTGYTAWSGERTKRTLREARDQWERVADARTCELRQREEKFRAIFSQTVQLMAVLDTDGNLQEANRVAMDLAGVELDHVLQRPFWEGPWWSHSASLQQKLREAIHATAAGEFVRIEATLHPSPDGQEHIVDFTLTPVKDTGGQVMFLLAMGQDITERKRAQIQLQQQKDFFETTLNALSHPFCVIDAETRTVLMMNSAAREHGSDGARTCHSLMRGRDLPCDDKDNGCPLETVKSTKAATVAEYPHRDRRGKEYMAEVHAHPIFDAGGNVIQVITYSLDVSARKKAEEELRRNLEALERFSRLAVDRELRMIEIKKETNQLLIRLGQGPKYRIVTDEQPQA